MMITFEELVALRVLREKDVFILLIFYAKDMDGKMKAIIELKGFYLENPPAQFRILGQQRMKHKGSCATQDYDDAGTDISKCKRSGIRAPRHAVWYPRSDPIRL